MLSNLILIFLLLSDGGDAASHGMAVPASAWGSGVLSGINTPASLVRLERNEISTSIQRKPGGDLKITTGTGNSWPKIAAAVFCCRSFNNNTATDTLECGISIAKVVTGSPFGFIEDFFGPNISIGVSGRVSLWKENEERKNCFFLNCGMQFSIFPTIAVGINSVNTLSGGAETGARHRMEYGVTYVSNRNLRGHFAISEGDIILGAELKVTDNIRIRTGSSFDGWSTGFEVQSESFSIDYGLEFQDNTSDHMVSFTYRWGERRSFR